MPTDEEKEKKKIRFEDLAPSLQDMINSFVDKSKIDELNNEINEIIKQTGDIRLTVGYAPPDAPKAMKELYIDASFPLPKVFADDNAWHPIHMVPIDTGDGVVTCTCTVQQTANQTIYITLPTGVVQKTFTCTTGTNYSVKIQPADGYKAGTLGVSDTGTVYADMLFSATPATSLTETVKAIPKEHSTNVYQFQFVPTLPLVRVSFAVKVGDDEKAKLTDKSDTIYNSTNNKSWFEYNKDLTLDSGLSYNLIKVTAGKTYSMTVKSSNYKNRDYGFILECAPSITGTPTITDE